MADQILNPPVPVSVINWTEYKRVADNYNTEEMHQYRFGAGPITASGTVPLTGVNGIDGPGNPVVMNGSWDDWFAMSGQLCYLPDSSSNPGMSRADNGSVYCDSNALPVFDYRITDVPDASNPWQAAVDPAITKANWQTNGVSPRVPVAVARSRYMTSVCGIAIFANGLIGVTSTGNDPNTLELNSFPSIKLPAGKVPTAVALTLNHEFALVTIWDTIGQKGQVAVIAIEGNPMGVPAGSHFLGTIWYWGQPNWPAVRNIKLLGYVDLPFAAPTSIEATGDVSVESGRDSGDNVNMNLTNSTQRADWYNNRSRSRMTSRSGYAIVASRAEGKVAFIDLQPLITYYRTMYFTTLAKYNETTTVAWPYTFTNVPTQMPVVAYTIDVPRPTAVAAGFFRGIVQPWSIWDMTFNGAVWDDGLFGKTAYIATEAGNLLMYDVTTLNSTAVNTPPTLIKTVAVGNNPISISYGFQAGFAMPNDLYILARGDRKITQLRYDGTILKQIVDSRMVDPVSVSVTYNSRGYCGGYASLAVLDYGGKKVHDYTFNRRLAGDANGGGWDPTWFYGYSTVVAGKPYLFSLAEVM